MITASANASSRRRGLDRQRQLTVMFVDVVSSTPLAEALDAERWRDILLTFHDICDRSIARYGGAIASRLGDGLMAHFGLENPHEDDPRRALLAGLTIQKGLAPLTNEVDLFDGVRFEARVGVHIGPVLITEISDRREIIGLTANEAARIESQAEPGSVAASQQIIDLVGDEFRFGHRVVPELKGVGAPIEIATVIGPAAPNNEAPATPLIGRLTERTRLLDIWQSLGPTSESPHAAIITGEAGIGKTRLAQFIAAAAAMDSARQLVFETREFDSTLPLHPVSSALEHQFGLLELTDEHGRLDALVAGLADCGAEQEAPALAQLVGLSAALLGEDVDVNPGARRELTIQASLNWIRAVQSAGPLVILFEDLQWADRSTIELIDRLVTAESDNLMVVMTARPEFVVPWASDLVDPINLAPISAEDVARMAEFHSSGNQLSDEQLAAVITASDGNPLYVDRLLGSVHATASATPAAVPPSLEHLLTTIVEAPGVDQALVGLLAAIGRRLEVPFVAAVLDESIETTERRLTDLAERGILERLDRTNRSAFIFHHALVQSTAYEHQLASDRKVAHARIAETIERTTGTVEVNSRSIARHLDLAGRQLEAIPHYLAASATAHRRGSPLEARRLVERGLAISATLADTDRDGNVEVELELQRGLCITSLDGYGSPEGVASAQRARALITATTRPALIGRALTDVGSYYMGKGRRDECGEIVDEMKLLLGDQKPWIRQFEALHIWHLGEYQRAKDLYLTVIDKLEEQARRGGNDPAVGLPADNLTAAYIQMTPICWNIGNADEAFDYNRKAIRRARSVGGAKGSFSEAFAMYWLCYLHGRLGDYQTSLDVATEMKQLCRAKGLTMWASGALIHSTIAQSHLDPNEEVESLLTAIIDASDANGMTTMHPYIISHRAQLLAALGRPHDALRDMTHAITYAHEIQEIQELAEIHRLRARLHHECNDSAAMLTDLLTAVATADRQGAVVYALRALADIVELVAPCDWPTTLPGDLPKVLDSIATPNAYPVVNRAQTALTQVLTMIP